MKRLLIPNLYDLLALNGSILSAYINNTYHDRPYDSLRRSIQLANKVPLTTGRSCLVWKAIMSINGLDENQIPTYMAKINSE
jgi:hypothetical protein